MFALLTGCGSPRNEGSVLPAAQPDFEPPLALLFQRFPFDVFVVSFI